MPSTGKVCFSGFHPWALDKIRHRHWQHLGYCCYDCAVLPTALWLCCAFVCPLLSPCSPHPRDTHAMILLKSDFILLTKALPNLKLISNCMICCPVIKQTKSNIHVLLQYILENFTRISEHDYSKLTMGQCLNWLDYE